MEPLVLELPVNLPVAANEPRLSQRELLLIQVAPDNIRAYIIKALYHMPLDTLQEIYAAFRMGDLPRKRPSLFV